MSQADPDIRTISHGLAAALRLLQHSYIRSESGASGWYRQFPAKEPGPTATAVGIMALQDGQELYDALTFLRSRQIKSDDPQLDGGWDVNHHRGIPVMEATGWVLRCLALASRDFLPNAPDVRRASAWVRRQQSDDGGWGSFYGCDSRVWLTCLGIRSLSPIRQGNGPCIRRGVDWLLAHRNPNTGCWGELADQPATVAHTAFALLSVAEARPGWSDALLLQAHTWLEQELLEHLEDSEQHYTAETYHTTNKLKGKATQLEMTLRNYGLPLALSALLRHPTGIADTTLLAIADKVLRTQLKTGYWPSCEPKVDLSIWVIWPYVQALSDARRWAVTRSFTHSADSRKGRE